MLAVKAGILSILTRLFLRPQTGDENARLFISGRRSRYELVARKTFNSDATMSAKVHIGALIRDEMRRQGRTNEWLADQLGVHYRTINKIFSKSVIDTHQLFRISQILEVDFFKCYSDCLHSE